MIAMTVRRCSGVVFLMVVLMMEMAAADSLPIQIFQAKKWGPK